MNINDTNNNKAIPNKDSMPFQVPEGYFDSLSDRIMERIDQEELSTSQKVLRYIKPVLSMAASILIIFSIIYVPVKILGPKIIANNKDNKELDYIDYYIANNYLDFVVYEEMFDTETPDESFIETMLLASISEIELMELTQ
jgi:hypothetical protein